MAKAKHVQRPNPEKENKSIRKVLANLFDDVLGDPQPELLPQRLIVLHLVGLRFGQLQIDLRGKRVKKLGQDQGAWLV